MEYMESRKGEKINIKIKYVMNIQTQERDVLGKKKKTSFCSWEEPPFKATLLR